MLTITDFINILHRYYKSPMVSMMMSCYQLLDCTQTEIANCLKDGLLLFLSFWKLSFVRSNWLSSFEREDSFVVKVVGWYQDTWVNSQLYPWRSHELGQVTELVCFSYTCINMRNFLNNYYHLLRVACCFSIMTAWGLDTRLHLELQLLSTAFGVKDLS